MIIKVKNLGVLREAKFELGDMTIICGGNNTGKTYATYALYGFLDYLKKGFTLDIDPNIVRKLYSQGSTSVDLKKYQESFPDSICQASKLYSKILYQIFASKEDYFKNSEFEVEIKNKPAGEIKEYEVVFGSIEKRLLKIRSKPSSKELEVSFIIDKSAKDELPPKFIIKDMISHAIKDVLYSTVFPNVFIASAERTGVAIFRNELDFTRNRLLEIIKAKKLKFHPLELLEEFKSNYALPVKDNVEFTRQIEDYTKRKSFIAKEHREILCVFANIIGGEYRVIRNVLYFIPDNNKRLRLSMDESSSGVRSLLDIGFYLHHVAQRHDLLMVDEPELNLHPENQRRIARLFARLINIGIKVFITTHSDYIIKELNTLIMLKNNNNLNNKKILREEGYKNEELLSADRLRAYIAEQKLVKLEGHTRRTKIQTLVSAHIDPKLGIEARSFDSTIGKMNRIQEDILFKN